MNGIHSNVPEIKLPTVAGQQSIITDCFAKLVHFVDKDAYLPYDYWITTRGLQRDVISWDHVYAINNAMRARSSREGWGHFVGQTVPELAAIPVDLDLIDGSEEDVCAALDALEIVARRISTAKGLTDMAASKVLYLMRPRLVAISDGYVRRCLGIPDTIIEGPQKGVLAGRRLREVHEAMRVVGLLNHQALVALQAQLLAELPVTRPAVGPFAGQSIPVILSKVRILDILLWSHYAIHGEIPHIHWRQWNIEQTAVH